MSSEENDEIDRLEAEISKKRKKKEPDELIRIEHVRGEPQGEGDLQAQLEAEKKRREEAELIIEAEATKQFLSDRDRLLESIPENRRERIKNFIGDDPDKMQQVKASLLLQGQDFEDDEDEESEVKVPTGRARLPDYMLSPEQRQTRTPMYSNPTIQKYSDLYAILRDPKSTQEEKLEAEQILDETFAEIRKGLRTRSRNDPYRLPSGTINHCWRCGFVTEVDLSRGAPCPNCGYRFGVDDFPRNPKFQPK